MRINLTSCQSLNDERWPSFNVYRFVFHPGSDPESESSRMAARVAIPLVNRRSSSLSWIPPRKSARNSKVKLWKSPSIASWLLHRLWSLHSLCVFKEICCFWIGWHPIDRRACSGPCVAICPQKRPLAGEEVVCEALVTVALCVISLSRSTSLLLRVRDSGDRGSGMAQCTVWLKRQRHMTMHIHSSSWIQLTYRRYRAIKIILSQNGFLTQKGPLTRVNLSQGVSWSSLLIPILWPLVDPIMCFNA